MQNVNKQDKNSLFWQIQGSTESHDHYSKVHGAHMGPTWVLSAPDGPNFGPMNLHYQINL